MKDVLLVGNPNCGKTTLFNALTGDNQRVGNWPGVTVEKKTGIFLSREERINLTDLPGIYSLASLGTDASQDERIAANAIVSLPADVIINVVDACHLERHLYLTSQLLELGKPVIIALNMMDIARQRGIHIDTEALSQQLNCPVVSLQAHKKIGVESLRHALDKPVTTALPMALQLSGDTTQFLAEFARFLTDTHSVTPELAPYCALRTMEGDRLLITSDVRMAFLQRTAHGEDFDILLADARYNKIHQIIHHVQQKSSDASEHFTAKADKIILHRFWALPIFFLLMYLMFLFAINVGGAFQDFFDITTDAVFVHGSAWVMEKIHSPPWLIALIANGVGVGINTVLTFIPVIAAMFFFLSLLETSGYMARAAFVVDKAMRMLGLPGKAFVPMIAGFGCNVPAIMAARTLDSERDRLLTVLMSPFMSCSARLAIYAVFVSAFFPTGGQNVVFALYLMGIGMAVLTGFMLRKTMLQGKAAPLILELPAYHQPALRRLLRETGVRLRYFIVRAGRMIIPVCVVLGGLNALTVDGGFSSTEASTHSVLSVIGQWLTPVFSPMGLNQDNWPATVGLLTGMLAKEVVVGSLNSLYSQIGHLSQATNAGFDFPGAFHSAVWSVPQNLALLGHALVNPILASAPPGKLLPSVYGEMASRFDGQAGAFAYLLFILLYIPCVSTMAAIRQEANRSLMWFSIIWSFLVAYTSAVFFYQLTRFADHPQRSLCWMIATVATVSLFVFVLRWHSHSGAKHAYANT